MKNLIAIIVVLIIIWIGYTLLPAGDKVSTNLPEGESQLVLLNDIRSEDDQTVAEFDPVVWLMGDEAWQAVAEDTECEVENADECMPSLYNNFYIRNTKKESLVYPVLPEARITLMDNAQPAEHTIGDVDEKLHQVEIALPFRIIVQDGFITSLEEVYIP